MLGHLLTLTPSLGDGVATDLVDTRAGGASERVQELDAVFDRRMVVTEMTGPVPQALPQSTRLFAFQTFLTFVQADKQHGVHAAQEDLELQSSAVAVHPVHDLLQSVGERAGVFGPLSSQDVSSAFAATADKHGDQLGKDAHHVEGDERDEKAGDCRSRVHQALLVALDLVGELAEQVVLALGLGVVDKAGVEDTRRRASQNHGKERAEHSNKRSDCHIAASDVGKLMSQNGFDLTVSQTDGKEALGGGDKGVARRATRGKSVGDGQRRDKHIGLGLEPGQGIKLVDQSHQAHMVGVAEVRRRAAHHLFDQIGAVVPAEERHQHGEEEQDAGSDSEVDAKPEQASTGQSTHEGDAEEGPEPVGAQLTIDGSLVDDRRLLIFHE